MDIHNQEEWSNLVFLGKSKCIGVYKTIKKNGIINGKDLKGECAIKIIKISDKDESEIIHMDILLKKINHENIIRFYGFSSGTFKNDEQVNEEVFFIYMEYINGYKEISTKKDFKESEIATIIKKIIQTLDYLHQIGIIHRDIKGSNILFNEHNDIKLIDFGSLGIIPTPPRCIGTPSHMAPEVEKGYTSIKSDIWSIGCTILEMVGCKIKKSRKPPIPPELTGECRNFIQSCFIIDPNERPDLNQLLNHSFLSDKQIKPRENISNEKIEIFPEFNESPDSDNFPSSITTLILTAFNQPIKSENKITSKNINKINNIPSSTNSTSLILPMFNEPINFKTIPESIKSLELTSFSHEIEVDSLPNTLTSLKFGESFIINTDTCSNFPQSIKKLEFNCSFQSPLHRNCFKLNDNLCELVLKNYNQKIAKGLVPNTVHTLTLGSDFKEFESLSHLPPSVINLNIVDSLNKDLQKYQQLWDDYLEKYLNQSNKEENHISISEISQISFIYEKKLIIKYLPSRKFKKKKDQTQPIIKKKNNVSTPINSIFYFIPLDTQYISMPDIVDLSILKDLPPSVIHITLPNYNGPLKLKSIIPESLKSIKLISFNHYIEDDQDIPESIETLKFGEFFELNENGDNIPNSLKKLSIGFKFSSTLKRNNNIPRKTQILSLKNYNQPIIKGSIPDSVYELTLGSNFTHFESLKNLPKSIINLKFGVSEDCQLSDDEIKICIPPSVIDVIIKRY